MAQQKLNEFYNLDNLINIEIDIPAQTRDTLGMQEPKGGWGYKGGHYNWFQTNSVTISLRDFQNKKFQNIGIIEKSFAGSKDNFRPSLRLDFARFQESNEAEIEALIGTKTLALNNYKQDNLLRCNFATVKINDAGPTVYVNIEAFKKPFLENTFNGNTKGNAYEIELAQDLTEDTWRSPGWQGTPSYEGYSKFEDLKDIKLLGKVIQSRDWNAVQKVVNIDAFLKFSAMETLLKHGDGFTQKTNNSFTYNDVACVANPTQDNLKSKFVPSGIDQILKKDRNVVIGGKPVIAQLVQRDSAAKEKLYKCIR